MPSTFKLKNAVGPGCRNRPIDVAYVQHYLNCVFGPDCMKVDGIWTPDLAAAIKAFFERGFDDSIAGLLLGRTSILANPWDAAHLGSRKLELGMPADAGGSSWTLPPLGPQGKGSGAGPLLMDLRAKQLAKYQTTHKKITTLDELMAASGANSTPDVFKDSRYVTLSAQVDPSATAHLGLRQFGGEVVDGFIAGTQELVKDMLADEDVNDIRVMAYMLATAYHESGHSMQPCTEDKGSYQSRPYGQPRPYTDPKTSKSYNYIYYGRGYVQLTGFLNYAAMTDRLHKSGDLDKDQDLRVSPELMIDDHDLAYAALSIGMREGFYSDNSTTLDDYISGSACDYKGARHTVNKTDCDSLIAEIAEQFEAILRLSTVA